MVYEEYFLQRLLHELDLRDRCEDPAHRSVHDQACAYYRQILHSFHESEEREKPD